MTHTLVVSDQNFTLDTNADFTLITFERYLTEFPKVGERNTRVINLCDSSRYLSQGYYCSLLAEARSHSVLPSVRTINEFHDSNQFYLPLIPEKRYGVSRLDNALVGQSFLVCLGHTSEPLLGLLAQRLFQFLPIPIMRVVLKKAARGVTAEITRVNVDALSENEQIQLRHALQSYTGGNWLKSPRARSRRWDMAILVNSEEPHPPSDKEALSRFVKAAAKNGIHAQLLEYREIENIGQFDALFIRETTAIDHHTYRLAMRAEKEGVVVIDDATSILRCCNKVFLHDAFSYNGVPSPRTRIVASSSEGDIVALENEFNYPMILKMPEGSFSRGVFKVKDRAELQTQLGELLASSALALVQEYLYTEFDWRIGVLNGRAIYSCKYMMARNHWQIYNHGANKRFISGGFETIPTFETPKAVLNAAVKAANMVGKGLYGVDIKQQGRHVYVIEVNDNPSLDQGVEDAYLGSELYMQIMAEFSRRLELRGRG